MKIKTTKELAEEQKIVEAEIYELEAKKEKIKEDSIIAAAMEFLFEEMHLERNKLSGTLIANEMNVASMSGTKTIYFRTKLNDAQITVSTTYGSHLSSLVKSEEYRKKEFDRVKKELTDQMAEEIAKRLLSSEFESALYHQMSK